MIIKIAFLLLLFGLTCYYYSAYAGAKTLQRILIPVFSFLSYDFVLVLSPGIPSLSFFLVTLLPLAFLVFYEERTTFRFVFEDALIIIFVLGATFVSYTANSDKFGLLVFLDKTLYCALPYFLIRVMVEREMVLRTLVALALSVTLVALASPAEALVNLRVTWPIQILWPDWVSPGAFRRNGLYRVYGPYGHPIHAAMIFSIALFIGYLTLRMKVFTNKLIPWAVMVLNSMAIFFTVSRSSWVMSVPSLLFITFAFVKRKFIYGTVMLTALVLVLGVAIPAMESYSKITNYKNADETQTSAAYRAQLFDNYVTVIMERPWTGYPGNAPVIDYQSSIDNYYLYLAIQYGIPVTALFAFTTVWIILRGGIRYFMASHTRDKYILWAIVGFLVYFMVLEGSVWLTAQARTLLYILMALAVNLFAPRQEQVSTDSEYKRWM